MEFAEEVVLLPGTLGTPPARDKNKIKDPKVWLAGELIIRCEHQCLSVLPQQLFLKTTVRKLVLTGNQLDSLPGELFQQLKELRQLRVGYNRLTYLPEEVQQLQHLETLDLQHNQLKLVPASLYKCLHLTVLNLNGNPLSSWLRELWPEPVTAAAGAAAEDGGDDVSDVQHGSNGGAGGSRGVSAGAAGGQESAAVLQQLKANTKALLEHLLQEQDPETQRQVRQARLAVRQEASRARLDKLLRVVDPASLAECHNIATSAQLGQEVLGQVEQLQAAAQALQAAVEAVQQHQQQHEDAEDGVPPGLQAELVAWLKNIEALCKPGKPAGNLYNSAHSLSRMLLRQQLQRGWRCAPQQTPAAAQRSIGQLDSAAGLEAAAAAAAIAGSTPAADIGEAVGPRRFLTSAERVRRKLAASGAKSYKEWAAVKQQQEDRQRRKLKDLAKAEVEGQVKVVAERAAKAVQNCDRERQWPSRRIEAFPPGTFSLTPEVLKAVRKAYYKTPPLEDKQCTQPPPVLDEEECSA